MSCQVCHEELMSKITLNLLFNTNCLMHSYLTGRKFVIRVKDFLIGPQIIKACVLQDSILAPLLYRIYVCMYTMDMPINPY